MAERKDCHALISRFEKLCKNRGIHVVINRYVERWTADSLLESMTMADLHRAMDHYFTINHGPGWTPTWQFFSRNADRLLRASIESETDAKNRAIARDRMRQILNES